MQAFGFDDAAAFARSNNQAAPIRFSLTAKAARGEGAAEQVADLRDAGARSHPRLPRFVARHRASCRQANEGLIYLQDEASRLLAHLLDVGRNQRVLDLTAAPGSKATHIAALGMATIVAGEVIRIASKRCGGLRQAGSAHSPAGSRCNEAAFH